MSKGRIRGETLAWTDLTPAKVAELLAAVEADPQAAIACRKCGIQDWEPEWIRWLNHEPGMDAFLRQLEANGERLRIERATDARQTEFITVIRARRTALPGAGGINQ